MRSFFRLALLALPLAGRVVCEEPASPTKDSSGAKPLYGNTNEVFRDLLNALPEESLHVALNSIHKFQEGIFESDRHGVERIHSDNPPLATKLIVAAVQDLVKRQATDNSTDASVTTSSPPTSEPPPPTSTEGSTETPPPTSEPPPPSTTDEPPPPSSSDEPPPPPPPTTTTSSRSAVIVPVPVTTTDSEGRTTITSSVILSDPTASIAVPVTTTNDDGETIVTSETKPAVIFTATDSEGDTFVTTSAVEFAPTVGQVLTSTNDEGSTFLTTYTPGGGRVSSIVLITTTGNNGQPSVITSYTFVEPAQATGAGQPTGTGGRPGLQSGAANKNLAKEAAMVGGALGGFFAFLI